MVKAGAQEAGVKLLGWRVERVYAALAENERVLATIRSGPGLPYNGCGMSVVCSQKRIRNVGDVT